jgi:hypothetical protein
MTKLVRFDAGDGETVLIEVDEVASDAVEPVARQAGEIAAEAGLTLSEAVNGIAPMIRTLKRQLNEMTDLDDDIEVKFGVKLSGEIQAVIAKMGSETTCEVTLKWKKR